MDNIFVAKEMVINEEGEFSLYLGDVDFEKSKIKDVPYNAKFKGVASTEKLDEDKQIVLQKGLNFEPFKKYGYFNDDHGRGTCIAEAIDKKAWYDAENNQWMVKGRFLPFVKRAQEYVDMAKSFEANDSDMRLRLSVEGKVRDISADESIVKKADVYRVAITLNPKNTSTHINLLAKAMIHEEKSGVSGVFLTKEDKRCVIIGRLAKSFNCSLELAEAYYDRYSI